MKIMQNQQESYRNVLRNVHISLRNCYEKCVILLESEEIYEILK